MSSFFSVLYSTWGGYNFEHLQLVDQHLDTILLLNTIDERAVLIYLVNRLELCMRQAGRNFRTSAAKAKEPCHTTLYYYRLQSCIRKTMLALLFRAIRQQKQFLALRARSQCTIRPKILQDRILVSIQQKFHEIASIFSVSPCFSLWNRSFKNISK